MFSQPAKSLSKACGAAALVLVSAGCATVQDCNPSVDPGFFDAIGCHASGGYGPRVTDLERTAEEERRKAGELAGELSASQQKQKESREKLVRKQQELTDLDRQLAKIEEQFTQSKRKDAALQARINRAKAELQRLKQAAQAQQDKAAQLEQVQRDVKALEDALKEAL